MAEGRAAIHATRALFAQAGFGQVQMEFLPIRDAPGWRAVRRQFAQILDKSCWFTHFILFIRRFHRFSQIKNKNPFFFI